MTKETFDLAEESVLVSVYIGQTGKTKLSKTLSEEAAEKHQADQKSLKGVVSLLQAKDVKGIVAVVNAARFGLYHRTLPWDDRGWRLLPVAQIGDFQLEMTDLKKKFGLAVDELITHYDTLEASYRKRVNDLAHEVPFPTKEQLRAGFQFQVVTMPVPRTGDIRLKLPAKAVEQLKKEVESEMADRLREAQEEIIIRLIDVVRKLDTQLKKDDGRLFKSLITNIRKQVDILPSLNVANDPEINRKIARVKKELANVDIEGIREDDTAKAQVARVTASILNDLQDINEKVASKPKASKSVKIEKKVIQTKEVKVTAEKKKSIVGDFVGFAD